MALHAVTQRLSLALYQLTHTTFTQSEQISSLAQIRAHTLSVHTSVLSCLEFSLPTFQIKCLSHL